MRIEQGLFAYLSTATAITSLVSTRIYPLVVPQDTSLPAITYQQTANNTDHHSLTGTLRSDGCPRASIQLDVYATTYAACKEIADAVRTTLDGFRGMMGTVAVRGCYKRGEVDYNELPADASSPGEYRISVDFEIDYNESIPTFS